MLIIRNGSSGSNFPGTGQKNDFSEAMRELDLEFPGATIDESLCQFLIQEEKQKERQWEKQRRRNLLLIPIGTVSITLLSFVARTLDNLLVNDPSINERA